MFWGSAATVVFGRRFECRRQLPASLSKPSENCLRMRSHATSREVRFAILHACGCGGVAQQCPKTDHGFLTKAFNKSAVNAARSVVGWPQAGGSGMQPGLYRHEPFWDNETLNPKPWYLSVDKA